MVYCYYISHAGMKHMKSSNIWNTVFIVCIMRILEFTTCFSPCMPSRLISLLKSFEIIFVLCIRLDTTSAFNVCISFFFFFFFFGEECFMLFQWVLCTVHGTHKPLFSVKLSLKIGLMALFTHLKIILL